MQRKIIHLDMDAFYASVETLDEPSLAGKPVVVGGDSNRGVVSAASYEARKFGVHSALSIAIARKRCPNGIYVRPRMWRYQEISQQIMQIFKRFTPLVEPLSLDEAFLDVTGSEKLFGDALQIASNIRKAVKKETGLTVSAGVASSKLIAKIASDMDKPDGLTLVPYNKEHDFLAPLPIKKLWGVGKATQKELALLGISTIGDLARIDHDLLKRKFGKHGTHLYYASRAIDEREVVPDSEIKSIGHEETFSTDLVDMSEITKEFLALCLKVGRRLRNHGLKARTLMVKTKYYDFVQTSRSYTLKKPTDDGHVLYKEGKKLLLHTQAGKKPLRLVGITAANLDDGTKPEQTSLFAAENNNLESRNSLNKAVDSITQKFGSESLKPAVLVPDVKKQES